MRKSKFQRKTNETEISASVNLDGNGESDVQTGIKYLDHMLTSLSTHSLIDIDLHAKGDLIHHIAEDVALSLGKSIGDALGERTGILRFGFASIPMDDALASASIDLVKRPHSVVDLKMSESTIEDMATEDVFHFFQSLATSIPANIHLRVEYGENQHHKVEALFKALAVALRQAISNDPRRDNLPTSKGLI
ncbi:MAG: imidazoleglycerol-phosphate dehydratase HisB [Nitrososphaerales archaeon]